MKKILLITSIFGLSALASQASARGNSEFNLSLFDTQRVTIEWDNQKTITFNRWSLEDVAAGNHTLRIYRDERAGNGGHRTILYDGRVLVPENSIVTASLLRNKSLDMNVTPKRNCGTPTLDQRPKPAPHASGRPVAKPVCNDHGNNHGNGHHNGNNNGHGNGHDEYGDNCESGHVSLGVNATEFKTILQNIENAWYEEDRMRIAKQAIENRNVTTDQVKQIMEKFWFEESRLEFAKVAYMNTMDKQNYYQVNSIFWFSSSIKALDDYIRSFNQ
jgi:hypothetical protein